MHSLGEIIYQLTLWLKVPTTNAWSSRWLGRWQILKTLRLHFFYDVHCLRRSYCANCSNHGHVDNKTDLSEPHYTIETEDFTFTCSGQSVFAKKYCTFNLELQRDAVLFFFCFAMCFSKFMDILTSPTESFEIIQWQSLVKIIIIL